MVQQQTKQQQKKKMLNLIAEDIIKSLEQQKIKQVKDYFKQNQDVQKFLQNDQDIEILIEIIDKKIVFPILKQYARQFSMTKTEDNKNLTQQKFIQDIKSEKDKKMIKKNKQTFNELVKDYMKLTKKFETNMQKYAQLVQASGLGSKQKILKKNRDDYKNNAERYYDYHYELLPPKVKEMVDKYDQMSEQQYQKKNTQQIEKELKALSKKDRQIHEKFELMNELLEKIEKDEASQDQLYEYSGLIGQVLQQLQKQRKQIQQQQQQQQAKKQAKKQESKKKQTPQANKKQQKQTPQANKKQQKQTQKQKQKPQANKKQEKQTQKQKQKPQGNKKQQKQPTKTK